MRCDAINQNNTRCSRAASHVEEDEFGYVHICQHHENMLNKGRTFKTHIGYDL